MSDYEFSQDKIELGKEIKDLRRAIYYKKLLPMQIKKEKFIKLSTTLKDVNFSKNMLILSESNIFKPVFILGLNSIERKVTYDLINAYRLLEIWFKEDVEYSAISSLYKPEILLINLDCDELSNKKQSELIRYIVSKRKEQGKLTWLFFNGSLDQLERLFDIRRSFDEELLLDTSSTWKGTRNKKIDLK